MTLKLAVIGNAPLTLEQQNEINSYDIVCRCNNAYAWRKNDKIDHLFYRPVSIKPLKSFPYYIFESNKCNIFHIDKNEKNFVEPKLNGNEYISLNTRSSIEYNRDISESTKKEKIPSCGYVAYAYTKKLYPDSEIHMYGFDFRVRRSYDHNMKYEKTVISNDKNVVFHNVTREKNLPLHHIHEHQNSIKI